jgi:probable 2-oxoglutarate dehydrogenase E1 component DHKTD1
VGPDSEKQLHNRVENAPLLQYVEAFRTFGHAAAEIDPLELLRRERVPDLDPARYNLTDPNKEYNVNGIIWTKPVGSKEEQDEWWSLSKITQHLHATYVGGLAYEFNHSSSHTEALWFAHYLESRNCEGGRRELSPERKKRIHDLIARSESFDHFMQAKFPNMKRYGLEGGESLLPALDTLFSVAAQSVLFCMMYAPGVTLKPSQLVSGILCWGVLIVEDSTFSPNYSDILILRSSTR